MKTVLCTPEFRRVFEKFSRARSGIAPKLDNFIEFRQNNDDRLGFNTDDTPYARGTPLHGYRHVHLHHGKCIVVYRVNPKCLVLLAMIDHDQEDSPRPLVNFLERIRPTDLVPFKEDEEELGDPQLLATIQGEIFELAAGHPTILRNALRGDTELFDLLGVYATANKIMATFGGKDKFDAFIGKTLTDYGVREGIRYWIDIICEAGS